MAWTACHSRPRDQRHEWVLARRAGRIHASVRARCVTRAGALARRAGAVRMILPCVALAAMCTIAMAAARHASGQPAATAISPAAGNAIRLPDGPGVNVVYAKCRTCHDLQYVVDAKGLLPAQWQAVLAGMRDYGLTISDEDQATVLRYLTTYFGSHPPPGPPAGSSGSATALAPGASAATGSPTPDGRQLFAENCATCHGAQGEGQPGYYPPLAGNADVARHALLAVNVVLHGLAGPLDVAGRHYDGAMPAFGHLSDAQVAAVVNYVRTWLDDTTTGPAVDAAQVAERRKQPMSPAQVHAWRAGLQ